MKMELAPVLIPTLNRYEHFERCIDTLSRCSLADKTDLFIALDYPFNDNQVKGYNEIRRKLNKTNEFKSVNIFSRDKNYGVRKNIDTARNEIFNKYKTLIISEDDNIFAPSFLQFVNKGLIIYENREDIFSISGYNSPIKLPKWVKNDVYLRKNYTAWGVGIWRKKWYSVDRSIDNYNIMISNKKNKKIILKNYLKYFADLKMLNESDELLGDKLLFLNLIDKGMYSIYPTLSRVRNMGHDGSGLHGGYSDTYRNQLIYMGNDKLHMPEDITVDEKLEKFINKINQVSLKKRFKYYIKRFLKP